MNHIDVERIAILKVLKEGIHLKADTLKDVITLRISMHAEPSLKAEYMRNPFIPIADMVDEQHIADHIRDMGKLEALEDILDYYSHVIKQLEENDKQER